LSRHFSRLTALAVALVALSAGIALATTGTAPRAAQLSLVRLSPMTVSGHDFAPRSHLRLVLTAASTYTRRVTASARGAFTAAFPVAVDRCMGWFVTAYRGRAAPVRLRAPRVMCPPA
jgi:hypothetical protein